MLFYTSTLFFVIASFTAYSQKGKYSRDENTIHDVKEIVKILPPHSLITVSKTDFSNWALQAYFYRYSTVSLTCDTIMEYQLVLKSDTLINKFETIPIVTEKFNLFRAK
jgi:hypothetical protein